MKRLLFISWIFLLSVSFGLTKMKADVRMPLIFGDHMVLQQDTKIAIFGWADAGETVEVVFAGQKVKTTADTDGTWRVNLKPIKTKKEGQTLTIAGKNKLVYSDVLVGDVWVASGQSNMEWGMKVRKEYADDIAASEDPLLRLFFVPKNTSLEPLTDIEVPQGTSNPERLPDGCFVHRRCWLRSMDRAFRQQLITLHVICVLQTDARWELSSPHGEVRVQKPGPAFPD